MNDWGVYRVVEVVGVHGYEDEMTVFNNLTKLKIEGVFFTLVRHTGDMDREK